jgi:hypothetical protein
MEDYFFLQQRYPRMYVSRSYIRVVWAISVHTNGMITIGTRCTILLQLFSIRPQHQMNDSIWSHKIMTHRTATIYMVNLHKLKLLTLSATKASTTNPFDSFLSIQQITSSSSNFCFLFYILTAYSASQPISDIPKCAILY